MASSIGERSVVGEVSVQASIEEVWNAWTTEEGVKSFFAPGCNIDLRPDGFYEIFFNPNAAPGDRGGDGMRVLAVQPMKMFSFTWNAPPSLPTIRSQRTHVTLRFYELDPKTTRVTLHHDGWGEGGEWDKGFEYLLI